MVEPARRRRRASYMDVVESPSHKVAEVVNGELWLSPRPAGPHTSVASSLGGELYAPFQRGRGGPGGWIILAEPELHLGPHIVIPDLAGWRRESLPAISDTPFFTEIPDWVCECLSPSTEKLDRTKKLPIYAAHGVSHLWLVSASDRTVEILRLENGAWKTLGLHHGREKICAEPFEAIELDLSMLWADLAYSTVPRGKPFRASERITLYWGQRAVFPE